MASAFFFVILPHVLLHRIYSFSMEGQRPTWYPLPFCVLVSRCCWPLKNPKGRILCTANQIQKNKAICDKAESSAYRTSAIRVWATWSKELKTMHLHHRSRAITQLWTSHSTPIHSSSIYFYPFGASRQSKPTLLAKSLCSQNIPFHRRLLLFWTTEPQTRTSQRTFLFKIGLRGQ